MSMKYTARHIQRFLEQGKIDPTLWKNHFLSLLPTQVPACGDCSEYKEKTCPGGRDPMLGLGARGPGVRGTALPRDQSKM